MKRYYTGLFAVMLIMVATALVLNSYGTHEWFGNSITGAVTLTTLSESDEVLAFSQNDVETQAGKLDYEYENGVLNVGSDEITFKVHEGDIYGTFKYEDEELYADAYGRLWIKNSEGELEPDLSGENQHIWTGIVDKNNNPTLEYSKAHEAYATEIGYGSATGLTPTKTTTWISSAGFQMTTSGAGVVKSTTWDPSSSTFTVTTEKDSVIEYEIVYIEDPEFSGTYAYYEDHKQYYDEKGIEYMMGEDGELYPTGGTGPDELSQVLVSKSGDVMPEYQALLAELDGDDATRKKLSIETKKTTAQKNEEAAKKADQDYQAELSKTASRLGLGEKGVDLLKAEDEAINTYLLRTYSSDKEVVIYDVNTGYYYIDSDDLTTNYNSNGDLGVLVTAADGSEQYVYKESKLGGARYYTCKDATDCGRGTQYKEDGDHKTLLKQAEKEINEVEKDVDSAREAGELEGYNRKNSVRELAYLEKSFQQQEQQLKGLLTGYLNKWIDKKFGGWSRGVPAGICAYVFNLEYYSEAGWNRVPMNASAYELQSHLVANSDTVIIEGEKEEITETQYRYAYSLRLLANQSKEWQTYLSNSCSLETSVEMFYDYGSLSAGEFFSFHYAGYADQDMIFDCEVEDCIYDQACVEFSDGSEPVCVSLINGEGFETPNVGSDYDCAVIELEDLEPRYPQQ